jgi:tetratricopeptide (TPR) repeat protein
MKLLQLREIKGPLAEDLFRATNGHPLSLEMVTDSSPTEAKYQVSKFFEERFYAALAEPERALLQLASVFRRPFPADALPKEVKQARKGSMLRETAPGKFEIHASLREFVYQSMSREERSRWHSVAADHYLRAGNPQERLYHLMGANRSLEAEMMISRMGEELLAEGNVQELWETLSSLTPSKPKYAQAVSFVKAKAASLVGRYETAWSLLEGISSEGEARSRADAYVEMGRIRSKQGELKEASKLFERALEIGTDSPASRARSLRGLGVVESKLGNYAKAQDLLERSARDAMAAMDSKGMLLAHMELGNVFIGRGMCEEAIDHFSKCAAGFGPVELTNVHVNLGVACATLGRSEEARVHLENAVKLADETGQPRAKAYALTSLAEVLVRSGALDQAKESCFRALDIVTELDDKLGISAAYANLGMAEKAAGELEASEEHYLESLRAIEGLDVPRSLGMRKLEFGQLLESKGDRAGAKRAFEDAREAFLRVGAKDLLVKAEQELGRSAPRRK